MIPFSKPDINRIDLKRVEKCIKSGWLTHGPNTKKFEKIFRDFTNSKFSTTVANCTSGLHLACIALGLKKGDEVIVPAQTHAATAHAAELTGAKVIFADVDPLNGNILFSEIKKKITKRTRCIIIVHMAGYPCDITNILKICKKKNIKLIEDCAHSLGTTYKKRHAGNFGICGVFSFYPTKQITTGEGGMLITNSKKLIDKIKVLKALGVNTPPELRKKQGIYDVTNLGLNYRMTDIQAALGVGQIIRYKKNLQKRKLNAKKYITNLKDIKNIKLQEFNSNNSYFIFQIFLKSKKIRNNILKKFKYNNIGASIHYATPVPHMSYYKKKYKILNNSFPNARAYADKSISLPVHSNLKGKMIEYISKIIKDNA
tara:strand:+ start:11241 stop:12353 length:1113 start_codon:yes stop_codon:yes gene_type:complete